MPSRTVIREFAPENYYHVYNRGVEKRDIFLDEQDYTVFLGLLKKYLSGQKQASSSNRHKVPDLSHEVKLLSYCLMPNHFHLLLYQLSENGITRLMRGVSVGYAMYFNNRYSRVGSLFQGRYKAKLIDKDDYLHHVSRYIHLNPPTYKTWTYSSYGIYTGAKSTEWVSKNLLLDLFDGNRQSYLDFVEDYHLSKQETDSLRWQLADEPSSI